MPKTAENATWAGYRFKPAPTDPPKAHVQSLMQKVKMFWALHRDSSLLLKESSEQCCGLCGTARPVSPSQQSEILVK